jgi:hypothetical protein
MRGRRRWQIILLAVIGLVGGTGLGLWIGWDLAPVEYVDTDIAYLHPVYQEDYLLMVSEAYALDGDLGAARARVALLSLPDPANAVADAGERAVARNAPEAHIRALARLAAALGVQREVLRPYTFPPEEKP